MISDIYYIWLLNENFHVQGFHSHFYAHNLTFQERPHGGPTLMRAAPDTLATTEQDSGETERRLSHPDLRDTSILVVVVDTEIMGNL